MHNIEMADGYLISKTGGEAIKVAYMVAVKGEPVWHRLQQVLDKGTTIEEGYEKVDPEYRHTLVLTPAEVNIGGDVLYNGTATIIRVDQNLHPVLTDNGGYIFYDTVDVGQMTADMWQELNAAVPQWVRPTNKSVPYYTRSEDFELLNPADAIHILGKYLKDEEGNKLPIRSMGFLGDHGKDGLMGTIELPSWPAAIADKIGSVVDEFLVFWLHPSGKVVLMNTPTVAVCQNTLIMAINSSTRLLHMNHQFGLADRFEDSVQEIYQDAMTARGHGQVSVEFMLTLAGWTEEDMLNLAQEIYSIPNPPDKTYRGKTPKKTLEYNWERKKISQEARQEFAVEVFSNSDYHEWAGITEPVKDTGFAAFQVITAMETKRPYRHADAMLKDWAQGERRRNVEGAYRHIITKAVDDGRNVPETILPTPARRGRGSGSDNNSLDMALARKLGL